MNTHVNYIQRFVGLSEYVYIRKMLNKNHLAKVLNNDSRYATQHWMSTNFLKASEDLIMILKSLV